jgi:adenine deaminase
MKISGNIFDIHERLIYPAELLVEGEYIMGISKVKHCENIFIMPGLIDAHVHVESSMLTPGAFAGACVPHGTIGVISDPHEIANVMGIDGVRFMIKEGGKVPVKFWFGAPSCVPATPFETSGGIIGESEIRELLEREDIKYLAEVMNFPGVINDIDEVVGKIKIAIDKGKRIDGHAPGLKGEMLKKYVQRNISTDHECSSYEEAEEKIAAGMKILVREGSAARNLDALKELFKNYPDDVMLCSDDIHPDMLIRGHINKLVSRLIKEGYDMFHVVRSATVNPRTHYNLNNGLLRENDKADFIIVDNPGKMNVLETWIEGRKVFDRGEVLFKTTPVKPLNKFNCSMIEGDSLSILNHGKKARVIEAFDGELLTGEKSFYTGSGIHLETSITDDILKIVVKERYLDAPPATALIHGFGLKKGAFAGSVAHDSHNVIGVGTNDHDLKTAMNEVIRLKGGLAVASEGKVNSLKLNIAGIMSDEHCGKVAEKYEFLSGLVKKMGCKMAAPFMTLSFMALLVIPELKLSDKGLFDGRNFRLVPLFY